MKKKLLIIDSLHPEAESILARHQSEIEWKIIDSEHLKTEIRNAHFLITRSTAAIDNVLLSNAKDLRLIVMAGAGIDGIDLETAKQNGILVMNTQEANSTSAAELTVGLILSLSRHISSSFQAVTNGMWTEKGSAAIRKAFRGFELSGKTLGIIGLGRVGSRVATRMKSFEMKVLAVDPYISSKQTHGIPLVTLNEVFEESDIISLHTPLTSETSGLVNRERLTKAKKSPLVVNTSRGGIVVEKDILEALASKSISGYAADVFVNEPLPAQHPFLSHPQMLLTPHLGAQTVEAQRNVSISAVQRVVDFFMTGDTTHALKI